MNQIASLLPYLAAVGAVSWVLYKLINFPLKTCPRCKGTRKISAGLLGRYRICTRCGGSGEVRGWLGRKN